ncbi:DNA-binding protein [Xanthomonas sp. AmX2]|uniref:DNA-binding protein n=1 Tax=Xanthomonas sp. TaxID=29446 RepID=UPI00197D54E5|nr:DNA-binding protein [Xanthomonas sp.]MBN6150151.1 DNA-binding protein [Xanthomonas sp.]
MARGITESDVHAAADTLVALGERPTVERIRAHLGTGSPNTVVRHLETWWKALGKRLANSDQARVATANVPEAIANLAGQWWALALDHARMHADEALASEHTALLDAREALDHDRQSMDAELVHIRAQADSARQAERLAEARGGELERLVEQLKHQVAELGRQRDAALARVVDVEANRDALQIQIQNLQEAARVEREDLTSHVRAIEDRAHAEIDRARQDANELRHQLAALRHNLAAIERDHRESLSEAAATAGSLQQELIAQRARADALDTQLMHLRDLPAALEAAWRKHGPEAEPVAAKPKRARKSRVAT